MLLMVNVLDRDFSAPRWDVWDEEWSQGSKIFTKALWDSSRCPRLLRCGTGVFSWFYWWIASSMGGIVWGRSNSIKWYLEVWKQRNLVCTGSVWFGECVWVYDMSIEAFLVAILKKSPRSPRYRHDMSKVIIQWWDTLGQQTMVHK